MESSQVASISPLEIRTGGGELITLYRGFPETLRKTYTLSGFNSIHAKGDFGFMGFRHFEGNGFSIWSSEYNISRPIDFVTRGEMGMLELSIPLVANIHSGWNGSSPEFVQNEQFELSYVPFADFKSSFRAASSCKTFDIHYSKEYLDRFSGTSPALGHFLERVDCGEPVSLTGRNRLISVAMKRLISDLLSFNIVEDLASYFYEAGALMMLTLALDRINEEAIKRPIKYSNHEIESASEVRKILVADFSEKYSIRDLARRTATSETKLQLAFKHVYGITIFEYAQTARLDFAKLLLMDTDATIQSIAERCGYPDNSNLTAAFRKRFGYTPDSFRARGK
ncbi:MAG TPA: AraC family transcriptional regulator [Puia sp.]|jgi:AraC-like DNA-binding protein|nr:AraC family transcriptional regulator [Puia sp.]